MDGECWRDVKKYPPPAGDVVWAWDSAAGRKEVIDVPDDPATLDPDYTHWRHIQNYE